MKMNCYPLFLSQFITFRQIAGKRIHAGRQALAGLGLTTALLLSGCGIIYIPDVQQGNMITSENVNRVKRGMTRQQVRFVLGTPLIQDPFHKNRWDYHYSYRSGKTGDVESSRATVTFRNGKVVKITKNLSPKKETK
jgi:outer membrane protein assembly factor BamE (lipoprotein component of BamABCDE complex)